MTGHRNPRPDINLGARQDRALAVARKASGAPVAVGAAVSEQACAHSVTIVRVTFAVALAGLGCVALSLFGFAVLIIGGVPGINERRVSPNTRPQMFTTRSLRSPGLSHGMRTLADAAQAGRSHLPR